VCCLEMFFTQLADTMEPPTLCIKASMRAILHENMRLYRPGRETQNLFRFRFD